MIVEVRHVLSQHSLEVAAVEDQIRFSSSRRTVPIHRSAIAFARGRSHRRAQDADGFAGRKFAPAGPPGAVRVRCDAEEVNAAGGVLHDEQDVAPVQQ
jgi:hypothetical protein